jgi:hydroxypyruvate isomerase
MHPMPKFCANLGFLFTEEPFLDRFVASAKAGFRGVEYSQPYSYEAATLAEILKRNQLQQVLFNMPAGDWDAGERGLGCLPDRVAEFRAGVETAISYAAILGNSLINCLAGLKPEGLDHDEAFDTLVENLRYAGAELAKAGMTLVVEPINAFDMPGFFLNTSAQAMKAIEATGDPAIKLQYDIYHMQRSEGEISSTIERLLPHIGHIQCAGVPGRTEPDRGELDYDHLFKMIDRLGYAGWVGAEYKPVGETGQGLGWLKRFGG